MVTEGDVLAGHPCKIVPSLDHSVNVHELDRGDDRVWASILAVPGPLATSLTAPVTVGHADDPRSRSLAPAGPARSSTLVALSMIVAVSR